MSALTNRPITPRDARLAVTVLTAMNLLNYFDRYVPSAVKEQFKVDLGLTDAQTSWPLTAFVVVYMIASPLFGALADRVRRTWLIALGVGLWSLAIASAAWATGFVSLLLARALVGVGEAAYATLAPLHVHRFVVDADDARTRMAAKTMAPVAHDAPNQVRTQGTAYWTVAFCRASGSCLPKMTPSTRRLPSECSQSSFDLAFILLLMGDNCGVTSARLAAGGRA